MKTIETSPTLADQVHEAILEGIAEGALPPGSRIIQEQLARELGVSRQPVQQALQVLRRQGVVAEAPGRGLIVAPLDAERVEKMYDVRAVMEGLACRKAAENHPERAREEGAAYLAAGREAVASGSKTRMIAADIAFHTFLYELSENPLIAPAMEAHWSYAQRVMGEVLSKADHPAEIWDQHARLLELVADGRGDAAEEAARRHITHAATLVVGRLRGTGRNR